MKYIGFVPLWVIVILFLNFSPALLGGYCIPFFYHASENPHICIQEIDFIMMTIWAAVIAFILQKLIWKQ